MNINDDVSDDEPAFAIATAAELSGMHPQTLRQYDRLGLVVPQRTRGGSRRYSLLDIERLREIAELSSDGVSLPAIARIIRLEEQVSQLHARIRDLEKQLYLSEEKSPRVFAAGATGSVVTIRQGTRVQRPTEVVVWLPPNKKPF